MVGVTTNAPIGSTLVDLNNDGLRDLVSNGMVYLADPSTPGFETVVGTQLGLAPQTFTSVIGADVDADGDVDL